MVEATLRPSAIAHMLAPLPRCATTTRPRAAAASKRGSAARDVLVGQAVEAVAAHAAVGDRRRQREGLRDRRHRAVERGVEAGDLRQPGRAREHGADRREVVRLVQRRQRDEAVEAREDGFVDAHRPVVLDAAVDDAVADREQPVLRELAVQEVEQVRDRAVVAQRLVRVPVAPGEQRAGGVAGAELRRVVEALDLARAAASAGDASSSRNSENLRLDEPALRTTIASAIGAPVRAWRRPACAAGARRA